MFLEMWLRLINMWNGLTLIPRSYYWITPQPPPPIIMGKIVLIMAPEPLLVFIILNPLDLEKVELLLWIKNMNMLFDALSTLDMTSSNWIRCGIQKDPIIRSLT